MMAVGAVVTIVSFLSGVDGMEAEGLVVPDNKEVDDDLVSKLSQKHQETL